MIAMVSYDHIIIQVPTVKMQAGTTLYMQAGTRTPRREKRRQNLSHFFFENWEGLFLPHQPIYIWVLRVMLVTLTTSRVA